MSTTAVAHDERRRGAGRILLLVLGSVVGLVALALLAGGGVALWADQTQRDADGYFTTDTERFETPLFALTHERVEVGDVDETPDWILDRFGSVRVAAASGTTKELFVGIGPADEVQAYLAGVGHDEADSFDPDDLTAASGGAPASPPAEQGFWAASTTGAGHETLTWDVDNGTWSLVVMNADGSGGVAADLQLGANPDGLLAIAIVLLVVGVLAGLGAAAMIAFGVGGSGGSGGAAVGVPATAAAGTYPVAVEARLDEPLSRGLWLVKWLLALPHVFVLVFLWFAFLVATVVAWFAIVATGRYPRSLFDFNLGVLRWTWRVSYYAFSGIGTDRYPPFSLGPEPDYPATLDVPYPERLSRGLALVKSWLLAIPHLIVVAVLSGSALAWTAADGAGFQWPGLTTLLTVFAGVVLLFRGAYPRDLWELIVGMNRWVYRVVAYVALMRDEYPPFRLDR